MLFLNAHGVRKMRWLVKALLLSVCVSAHAQSAVKTESGDLVGMRKDGVRVYLGVPFAAPPVGPLRWQLPKPVDRRSNPLHANKLGDACVQTLSRNKPPWTEEFMVQNGASEDCLNLNVWAPATGQAHAVIIFLHGGGFAEGSNGISSYDGEALARRGVVVVTANYRLGVLGYLANTALTRDTPQHTAGNYAIGDQLAALRWVQRNIAAFGGNPKRVTLAGQSAGAESVVDLLAAPSSKGLFQRVIINSAPPLWPAGKLPEASAAIAAGDAWTNAHGGTMTALRGMSAEDVLGAKDAAAESRRPIAGGALLPMQPGSALQKGNVADVPVILGWDADDGVLSPTYGKLSAEQFRTEAIKRYGASSDRFLGLYPATDDAVAKMSQKASVRDRNFIIAAMWAETWRTHQHSPVFLYYFRRVPPWPAHPEFGAHHTAELAYFFGTLDKTTTRAYDAADRAVSEAAQQAWVHFAETGNPGSPWKQATGQKGPWTVIDQPLTSEPEVDDSHAAFWRELLKPKP
jgi:para-nitrobenzyl esterase